MVCPDFGIYSNPCCANGLNHISTVLYGEWPTILHKPCVLAQQSISHLYIHNTMVIKNNSLEKGLVSKCFLLPISLVANYIPQLGVIIRVGVFLYYGKGLFLEKKYAGIFLGFSVKRVAKVFKGK